MSEKQQVPSAGPDFVIKLPQDQCGDVRRAQNGEVKCEECIYSASPEGGCLDWIYCCALRSESSRSYTVVESDGTCGRVRGLPDGSIKL